MDSFSEKEMNGDGVKFDDKRVVQLAIGSGTSIDTVRKLLEQ
jgi:signal recognition particle GTPase